METVKINMVPKGAVKAAHASQGDAPRVVRFELFDEFLPYTLDGSEDITLKVVRPDTEEIVSSVTNTEEAYIDVSFTSEMTAIRGVANCEIKISKSGADLGSHNFDLNIERDAYGEDITVETASGAIATFITNVIDLLQEVKCEINATGGNGTPDNPIPIVGYTEANITRCGVNLFSYDLPIHDGRWSESAFIGSDNVVPLSSASGWTNIRVKIPENGNITLSGFQAQGGVYGAFLGSDDTTDIVSTFLNWQMNKTFNVPNGAKYIGLCFFNLNTEYLNYPNAQLEIGSSGTTVNPYNGQTYTIPFGQTVYGGVLDVTRGKLAVTFDVSNFSDITGWSYANGFFRTSALASIIKKPANQLTAVNATCPIYNNVSWQAVGDNDYEYAVNAVSGELIIKDSRYTDVSSFLAGVSGVPFAYELATPFDIDLTPEQIEALLGVNNVWSDTNGETEVKFYVKEA